MAQQPVRTHKQPPKKHPTQNHQQTTANGLTTTQNHLSLAQQPSKTHEQPPKNHKHTHTKYSEPLNNQLKQLQCQWLNNHPKHTSNQSNPPQQPTTNNLTTTQNTQHNTKELYCSLPCFLYRYYGGIWGHGHVFTINCKKKNERSISTTLHCRKLKPKCPRYGQCQLTTMMLFRARVCALQIVKWGRGIKVPPNLLQTQTQAHNHDATPV